MENISSLWSSSFEYLSKKIYYWKAAGITMLNVAKATPGVDLSYPSVKTDGNR